MPAPVLSGDDHVSRWGYVAAILVSALAHVAFFFLVLVVLPGLLASKPPPPSYTVKIVDSLPAGELGTHLPRLSQDRAPTRQNRAAEKIVPHRTPISAPTPPPPPPDNDKNVIALNTRHPRATPVRPTATPTPPPLEPSPTPAKSKKPRSRATPVPTSTPHARRQKPSPVPSTELAKASVKPTPNVNQEMAKLHAKLMAEHLREMREEAARDREDSEDDDGPVMASRDTEGSGYGVGGGSGSAGVLQSPEFLLYLQDLQKKIKDAWNFASNDPKLTATVTVGINPDGSLNEVRVTDSSRNPAFDDSVVRAIRLAAPFPAPPEKYRSEFTNGYPVIFNLGALKGGDEG